MSNTASYIGKEPTYGFFTIQSETGDGSTVAYTLDVTAASTASLLVSVSGVVQQPSVGFNVNSAGSTITFTSAPAASAEIWILWLGKELIVPVASSANSAMITSEGAITSLQATDDFLVYDTSASALKKVNWQYVHTGPSDMAANTVKVRDANSTGAPSDKAVTNTQLLIGDGTGFTAATLSGDVTNTNTGAVTIANDAVTTVKILDANVTLAKIASQAANTVLVRDASSSGVVSAKALATTEILIGDGTGFTAAALSGDVTMANTGAVTIASNAVQSGMVNVDVITAQTEITEAADGDYLLVYDASATAYKKIQKQNLGGGIKWEEKTAAFNAAKGTGYLIDCGTAVTATLPASPSLGHEVRIIDGTGEAATNNITVARNSENIQGAAADLTIATNRAAIGLVYYNAAEGWLLRTN